MKTANLSTLFYNKIIVKNRSVLLYIVFVILAGVFVFIQPSSTNKQILVSREIAKVAKVVDGDTIKVLIDNKEDTVRLIGIDSPEILDERKPVQCFGKQASVKAK